jgi:hypothetical protein
MCVCVYIYIYTHIHTWYGICFLSNDGIFSLYFPESQKYKTIKQRSNSDQNCPNTPLKQSSSDFDKGRIRNRHPDQPLFSFLEVLAPKFNALFVLLMRAKARSFLQLIIDHPHQVGGSPHEVAPPPHAHFPSLLGQVFRSRKLRLTTEGDPLRWPRDTPLSIKVGTKFRQQVAVAQSV